MVVNGMYTVGPQGSEIHSLVSSIYVRYIVVAEY